MKNRKFNSLFRQRGASIVEFAFISMMFFMLLFGIVEFGRLFFNINSVQEITRLAAREQVVRQLTETDAVQREAMLRPGSTGRVYYPGTFGVSNDLVQLSFFNSYKDAACDPAASKKCPASLGKVSPETNLNSCLLGEDDCIRFVRVTLGDANFEVLAPLMPFENNLVALPNSTVIMPAEALGLNSL